MTGLPRGSLPTFALPVGQPRLHAVFQVSGIGYEFDFAGFFQAVQGLDRRLKFHPVVGGLLLCSQQFARVPARLQHDPPATRTRVPMTSPIGVGFNLLHGFIPLEVGSAPASLSEMRTGERYQRSRAGVTGTRNLRASTQYTPPR